MVVSFGETVTLKEALTHPGALSFRLLHLRQREGECLQGLLLKETQHQKGEQ
jgi:hypothetical protein